MTVPWEVLALKRLQTAGMSVPNMGSKPSGPLVVYSVSTDWVNCSALALPRTPHLPGL